MVLICPPDIFYEPKPPPLLRSKWNVAMKRIAKEVDDFQAKNKDAPTTSNELEFQLSKWRFLCEFEKLTPEKMQIHLYSAIHINLGDHWGDPEWLSHYWKYKHWPDPNWKLHWEKHKVLVEEEASRKRIANGVRVGV